MICQTEMEYCIFQMVINTEGNLSINKHMAMGYTKLQVE